MVTVTWPSGSTRTKAFGEKAAEPTTPAALAGAVAAAPKPTPISSPPPTAAPAMRKVRRESVPPEGPAAPRTVSSAMWSKIISALLACFCNRPGRLLDGSADARVGAAAADVAGHRSIDVGVVRVRVAGAEGR